MRVLHCTEKSANGICRHCLLCNGLNLLWYGLCWGKVIHQTIITIYLWLHVMGVINPISPTLPPRSNNSDTHHSHFVNTQYDHQFLFRIFCNPYRQLFFLGWTLKDAVFYKAYKATYTIQPHERTITVDPHGCLFPLYKLLQWQYWYQWHALVLTC